MSAFRMGLIGAAALIAVPSGAQASVVYSEDFNSPGFLGALYAGDTNDHNNERYVNPTIDFYTAVNFHGWTFSNGSSPAGPTFINAYDATNLPYTDGAVLLNENGGGGTAATTVPGLTPGGQYVLSFLYYGDNRPGGTYGLQVDVNGGSFASLTGTIGAAGGLPNGILYSGTFFADIGGNAQLNFSQYNSTGEGSPIFDDVTISQTPLPSTWTMLIAGFAGLGFMAYRGRKKVALAAA